MTSWVRLTLPAAVVASISSPSYAVQYLTVDAAQKLAFPAANRFVENGGLTWKAQAGDKLLGLFVVDHVIGKNLYIDYAVALDASAALHSATRHIRRSGCRGSRTSITWLRGPNTRRSPPALTSPAAIR